MEKLDNENITSLREARELNHLISVAHGKTPFTLIFDDNMNVTHRRYSHRTILGTCCYNEKEIHLYVEGYTVETLLHEIAHVICGYAAGHGWAFEEMLETLRIEYLLTWKEKIRMPRIEMKELLEEILDEVEDTLTMTMGRLGKILVENKMNNEQNLTWLKNELVDLGVKFR